MVFHSWIFSWNTLQEIIGMEYIYIQVEGIPLYPYISRISRSWIIMEYLGKIQVKSNQKWAEQSAFEIVTDDFPSDQKTLHFGRGFPSHET